MEVFDGLQQTGLPAMVCLISVSGALGFRVYLFIEAFCPRFHPSGQREFEKMFNEGR